MTFAQMLQFGHRWVRGVKDPIDLGEIEVDIYAGGGGASLGMEKVTGRPVHVAINHNANAIKIHKMNHAGTEHLLCDVREADPRKVMPGRQIGLLHLSPDCTHHSRAKGGKPVQRHIRALANVAIPWIKVRRPRVVTVENVAEFLDWGPLMKGKGGYLVPDPKRKGQSFRAWVRKLEREGYKVEWKLLKAADFGAPTIRKRLFIVARNDGQPINWPSPTHAPAEKAAQMGLLPYRSAAECIDWELPGRSIFGRKNPLASATMRRLAKGTVKEVLQAKKGPFLIGAGGPARAGRPVGVDHPMGTTLKKNSRAVAVPFLSILNHKGDNARSQSIQDPLFTLTASRDARGLVASHLVSYHQEKAKEARTAGMAKPLPTQDTSNRFGLVGSFLTQIAHYNGKSERVRSIHQPVQTLTAHQRGGDQALSAVFLQGCGGRDDQRPPRSVKKPARATTQKESEALAAANLVRFKRGAGAGDAGQPLPTATGTANDGLQISFLEVMKGTAKGYDPRKPMPTIQAQGNHIAEVRLFLQEFYEDYENLTAMEKLGIVEIEGTLYQITDITLRMLEPRELLRAQFGKYADGYILVGTKKVQVAAIGNSVCPEVEEALLRVNYEPLRMAA